MKYLIPNFAFEDELCQPGRRLSSGTQRAVRELAPLLGLVAEQDDMVVVPNESLSKGSLPEGLPDCLLDVRFQEESTVGHVSPSDSIVPWGWTETTRSFALGCGVPSDRIPEHAAVHHVNSRSFNAGFDKVTPSDSMRLPFGNSFGQLCRSMAEVHQSIRRMLDLGYGRWLAKPQISHAGRNRLIVTGNHLNAQQNGWLEKRITDGVYLEPWVNVLAEHSIQFEVPGKSSTPQLPELVGVTRLLNDNVGRYAGNLLLRLEANPELLSVVEHGRMVCTEAQAAGYFGPIGIDCFQFVDTAGNTGFRVCNDINARFTMGRLAVHLERYLSNDETAAWCQISNRNIAHSSEKLSDPAETAKRILSRSGFKNVTVVRTSPLAVAGEVVLTTTILLAGTTAKDVLDAQQILQNEHQSQHGK